MVSLTHVHPLSGRVRQVACCLLALVLSCALGACADVDKTVDELLDATYGFEEEPIRPSSAFITASMEESCYYLFSAYNQLYWDALETYAHTRAEAVNLVLHNPQHITGWIAYEDLYATDADPTGRLTIWEDNYYVTHDWSQYGKRILKMVPGDTVEINGRTILVQGVFCYPKEAYDDEIRALLGFDTVVIQTCEPNTDLNRIVYGEYEES